VKDRQSLVIFLVILGIVLLGGFICYNLLEIVPYTTWSNPSREVKTNEYLVLERWLLEAGFTFNYIAAGSVETILKAPEKTVLIDDSRFNWINSEQLVPWIQEGGRLIVSVDTPSPGEALSNFMALFNVKPIDYSYDYNSNKDESDPKEDVDPDFAGRVFSRVPGVENSAWLDWRKNFAVTVDPEADNHILVMGNKSGLIKLVKVDQDKGWVLFTGKTEFLQNSALPSKENMELAGELFFNDPGKSVLFIRKFNDKRHLLGNLAERGNPMALAVSLALLVVVGFWMVIPSFGRNKPEPERPGKPLRERFLAEGTFLAKYHALGKYIEIYRKELEQRRGVETASVAGTTFSFREFVREQKRLTEQLEEL